MIATVPIYLANIRRADRSGKLYQAKLFSASRNTVIYPARAALSGPFMRLLYVGLRHGLASCFA
jgi:hypothetical protein